MVKHQGKGVHEFESKLPPWPRRRGSDRKRVDMTHLMESLGFEWRFFFDVFKWAIWVKDNLEK